MARFTVGEIKGSNHVVVNAPVTISVSITKTSYTWDYIKNKHTWASLKVSGETYDTLRE